MKSLRGDPFFALACQGGGAHPAPVSYATTHSRKVSPPQAKGLKQSQALQDGIINYFITMHHQTGVNFENFTAVKFRDILLTRTGHRDRRLSRDSPGQAYGRSNRNHNLKPKSYFRFIREKTFAIPSFD